MENTLNTRNVVATGIPHLVKIINIIGGSKYKNVNCSVTGILVKSPKDISPLFTYHPIVIVIMRIKAEYPHK